MSDTIEEESIGEQATSVSDDTPQSSWLRKIRNLVLLTLALYIISLLVINTSWFKNKITQKLAGKSGLEWEIGHVIWFPFSDVKISDIESKMGSGGLEVASLSVSPVWSKIFSGKLMWDEMLVDGVVVDVEQEWLIDNLKNYSQKNIPKLKPVQPKPPKKKEETKVVGNNKPIKRPTKPSGQRVLKPKKKEIPTIPVGIDRWLKINNLSVRYRSKDKTAIELKNIAIEIPFSGKKAVGFLNLDQNGKSNKVPIHWNEKEVVINEDEIDLYGVKIQFKTKINPKGSSPIFVSQIDVKRQPLKYQIRKPNLKIDMAAENVAGRYILSGNLLSPQTWNGIGSIDLDKFSVQETQKTMKKLEFDKVYARARMLHGNLIIEDAQARSFDLNLMANGVVMKNTYLFGIVRCVATSAYKQSLQRIHHGTKAIKVNENSYHLLENLDNPDRHYFDIRVDGKLSDLEIKHNRADQWQKLKLCLDRFRNFKDNELKEDGLFNRGEAIDTISPLKNHAPQ